jgi:hypothetical protein
MDDHNQIDQNENQALHWFRQYAKPFQFTNDVFNEFFNFFIGNINQFGAIPKDQLTASLIKIEESILDSLRTGLSIKLLSLFTPPKGETLTLKEKKKPASFCVDIFLLTALIIDVSKANIQDMRY